FLTASLAVKKSAEHNGPRPQLAPQTLIAGNQRGFRQRRDVGAVQECDIVRDVEEMALARKRGRRGQSGMCHRGIAVASDVDRGVRGEVQSDFWRRATVVACTALTLTAYRTPSLSKRTR